MKEDERSNCRMFYFSCIPDRVSLQMYTNVASGGGSSYLDLDMRITKNSFFQRVDE
jgi:hypothetical protein